MEVGPESSSVRESGHKATSDGLWGGTISQRGTGFEADGAIDRDSILIYGGQGTALVTWTPADLMPTPQILSWSCSF
ncbi:hypothetical protein MTP99_000426 [Tenebrio molitor]|jgi:hypothetical protein|nr:hypothetical protein MTP99_000426 [Tenebrio molitor]